VTPYRAVTHRRRGLIESEIPPIHDNVQEEGGAAPYSAITCKRRDLVRSSGVGFRDEGNSASEMRGIHASDSCGTVSIQ
jgi:hypothetical protein